MECILDEFELELELVEEEVEGFALVTSAWVASEVEFEESSNNAINFKNKNEE